MVCPQWGDQRAEKVIKEVCPSISGLLSIKNDLSLRWTGYLTKSLLSKSHGSSLISWMTGQFLPLAVYKTGNFWRENLTSQWVVRCTHVLLIVFLPIIAAVLHLMRLWDWTGTCCRTSIMFLLWVLYCRVVKISFPLHFSMNSRVSTHACSFSCIQVFKSLCKSGVSKIRPAGWICVKIA